MRSQRGITITALIILIIVTLIIAGVGIGMTKGQNSTVKSGKSDIFVTELREVQQAVLETYIKYKQTNNSNNIVGEALTYNKADICVKQLDSELQLRAEDYDSKENVEIDEYYYQLNPENLSKIGIKNNEDTYIVNYSTGEVFNYTIKVTGTGAILYTYVK